MVDPRPFIIVSRRIPEPVEQALAASFRVRLNRDDRRFTPGDMRRALAEADGVMCTLFDPLGPDVLLPGPHRCRILANFGAGVDHVALPAARTAGLLVTNTPDVLTDCTADLTIALILMTLRGLGAGERRVRAGRWKGWGPTDQLGRRVTGRTLGVVGFGRIGRAVAQRASRGFEMPVLAWSRSRPDDGALRACNATWCETLEELLERSDVVTLHVPGAADTSGMMNTERLARMKAGSVLINTARGSLVDEAALVAALDRGHLEGAGLDVFLNEPELSPALASRDDVVVLPHLGSATLETRVAMGMKAVVNLRAYFGGTVPPDLLTQGPG
jgi:lactate dehydrogenase-like 2-hydroxyacid dehydrogenase